MERVDWDMREIRLLIVDDVEDNRLVLHAICRKMEGFVIKEACDGVEAVAMTEEWHPHIILMDVMMPNLDGFEASKIIKARFPDTIIMVVTAVIDPHMEANMSSIGVAAYVHKPIDKELIRFKLQSFGSFLRGKEGEHTKPSSKEALNPFSKDVRSFKTIFDVCDPEGMMDFGIWVLERCEERLHMPCAKVDPMIEMFYEIMRMSLRKNNRIGIIIEESFEEMFLTMQFAEAVTLQGRMKDIVEDLEENCYIRENIVCIRLGIKEQNQKISPLVHTTIKPIDIEIQEPIKEAVKPKEPEVQVKHIEPTKTRSIVQEEKELLRQSFVNKTTAVDYVRDIGGDVLDEIRDLESLDGEWIERLTILESDPSIENIRNFVDNVLGVYVRAINNLFEFTALAYALSSLGSFMKEHAEVIVNDEGKLRTLVMLIEHLGNDLSSWREHLFGLQDAADIHYLDSSFFSSCMQIEQIVGNTQIATDDDNDLELF